VKGKRRKKRRKPVVDLESTIKALESIDLRLWGIDHEDLSREEKNQLAEQLNAVSIVLTKLRNADLQNLADSFSTREPELRRVAGRLEKDLSDLTDAVDIINTVSAAMGTITQIANLIA
jgi:hypothetical protein